MQQIIPAAFSMGNAAAAVPAEQDDGNVLTFDDVQKSGGRSVVAAKIIDLVPSNCAFSKQPAEWPDADVESVQAVHVRSIAGTVVARATSSAAAPTESANVPGVNAAEGALERCPGRIAEAARPAQPARWRAIQEPGQLRLACTT